MFLRTCPDRVLPAEADGGDGGHLRGGALRGLQAAAELQEPVPERLGAHRTGGLGRLQQRDRPAHAVHGHQRGLPGAHPGRAQAGQQLHDDF